MKYVYVIFLSLMLNACSLHTVSTKQNSKFDTLTTALLKLDKKVNQAEAKELALTSLEYSTQLIKEYDLVTPPLYHNFLVNIGMRERGLCWQFAYDMLAHTLAQNFQSFDYYIGGANINDYWEEHNTLVVTCKGCKFSDGVVLDPWRHSGTLYFSKVNDDKEYSWSQRGGLRN